MSWFDDVMNTDLGNSMGELMLLIKALGSLIGIGMILFYVFFVFILPTLSMNTINLKVDAKTMIIGVIIVVICGPTFGFQYFS